MNKNIIIAILVVIIIAVVGFMVFSQHPATTDKMNTQFNILSDNTLANGDQVQFQLKEENGSAIAGEKVKIGLGDDSGNVDAPLTGVDGVIAKRLAIEIGKLFRRL